MDHAEEQASEIEALESIYYDSFTVLCAGPYSFQFSISGEGDEGASPTVEIRFTFTTKYPEEAPTYEIVNCENVEVGESALNDVVNAEIENNLGIPMVFTIASAVQEYLNGIQDEIRKKGEEEKEEIERKLKEEEEKKFHGTPVTIETFLAWKLKFEAEIFERKRMKEKSAEKLKMTGKELFLSDKNIMEEEILEGENAGVTIDESLFEDLDDLDLEDDPDFDPNDFS